MLINSVMKLVLTILRGLMEHPTYLTILALSAVAVLFHSQAIHEARFKLVKLVWYSYTPVTHL